MRRFLLVLAGLLGLLLAYVGFVVVVNQNLVPEPVDRAYAAPDGVTGWKTAGDSLSVMSWNIGYAGLGAGSDFVADGGKSLFPPSREAVAGNLKGIVAQASAFQADIKLFQEVSDLSPLSFWTPVRKTLIEALGTHYTAFRKDVATEFLPFPLAIVHGTLIATDLKPGSEQIVPLPGEPKPMMGFLKRRYALQVVRIPIAGSSGDWVICNVHLSAFDDGGETRRKQISAVMDFARTAYENGDHVIIGGDWNMVLADPGWPSTTPEEFLFWIFDFPREALPEGFSIAADPAMPTVRTLYKSYVKGENYVTGIDGFVVSPNVAVKSVTVTDTGFVNTDHMPVVGVFSAK